MKTIQVDKDTQKAFNKAKVALMGFGASGFIATVLFSQKFQWSTDIPTACTNGLTITTNPDFFMRLPKKQRVFLLAHEAWHVALKHLTRMLKKHKDNFKVWNMATDYYINYMLVKAGFEMIEGGLYSERYADQTVWSAYKIFDDIMENGDPEGNDPDDADEHFEAVDDTTDEGKEIARKVEDVIVRAAVQAKMKDGDYGNVPGDIAVEVQKLLEPKLPWNVILRNILGEYAKDDWTFRRPNRRYLNRDMYLPSQFSETIGHIIAYVDTSCSVTDEQFNMIRSECQGIKNMLNPKKFSIVDFDTKIHAVHSLDAQTDLNSVKFHGRGGTDMTCIFEHLQDLKDVEPPKVVLIFSDMECSPITEDPKICDIIWVRLPSSYGFKPTFGKVIDMEE